MCTGIYDLSYAHSLTHALTLSLSHSHTHSVCTYTAVNCFVHKTATQAGAKALGARPAPGGGERRVAAVVELEQKNNCSRRKTSYFRGPATLGGLVHWRPDDRLVADAAQTGQDEGEVKEEEG